MTLTTILMPQQIQAASIYHKRSHAQTQLAQLAQPTQQQWHKKRSVDMGREMPWLNPCGGIYLDHVHIPVAIPRRKKILNDLRVALRRSYSTISMEHVINIKKMSDWSTYRDNYQFLPTLNTANMNIALRVWHQHMQMYVAAFHYLYAAKSSLDHQKTLVDTDTAIELRHLFVSAQKNLCELETALNRTMQLGRKISKRAQLRVISKAAMQHRLKFTTDLSQIYAGKIDRQVADVNVLDMKILKHRYFAYMRAMLKKLRVHTKPTLATQSDTRTSAASTPTKLTKQPKQTSRRRKSKRIE